MEKDEQLSIHIRAWDVGFLTYSASLGLRLFHTNRWVDMLQYEMHSTDMLKNFAYCYVSLELQVIFVLH